MRIYDAGPLATGPLCGLSKIPGKFRANSGQIPSKHPKPSISLSFCATNLLGWLTTGNASALGVKPTMRGTQRGPGTARCGDGIAVSVPFCDGTFPDLDGPNRQSPIASVQRTRSTLASQSAVPLGTNVKRMNDWRRQSRDSNRSTTNARSVRTNFCVSGEV